MASRSDDFMILGDFNIHICCPSKPLDVFMPCGLFNLVQSVTAPTHQKGHTLVLSSGFTVSNIEIRDVGVSDHFMILFESIMFCSPVSTPKPYSSAHSITSTTATTFSNTFMHSHQLSLLLFLPARTLKN